MKVTLLYTELGYHWHFEMAGDDMFGLPQGTEKYGYYVVATGEEKILRAFAELFDTHIQRNNRWTARYAINKFNSIVNILKPVINGKIKTTKKDRCKNNSSTTKRTSTGTQP